MVEEHHHYHNEGGDGGFPVVAVVLLVVVLILVGWFFLNARQVNDDVNDENDINITVDSTQPSEDTGTEGTLDTDTGADAGVTTGY